MKKVLRKIAPVLGLAVLIWIVEPVNLFTGHSLSQYGIVPRTAAGLIGIPLAPFLHFGLPHAFSNTIPLLVLGSLLLVSGKSHFWLVTIAVILGGGLMTWALARGAPNVHAGASGLVFGYFGYLVTRGLIDRRVSTMAITVAVVLFYGGMIWGLLPTRPFISFESHIFGFGAGIAVAWFQGVRGRAKEN